MARCVSCGAPIPDGQRVCSMCYGDPAFGKDQYFEMWLEDREREEEHREQIRQSQEDL
jgi:hypothetical protein